MEKNRILFINTNIGKIESTMTVNAAEKEIKAAKSEGRLAKIKKPENEANLGGEMMVRNQATEYLDMENIKVFSYVENKFKPKEEEKEDTKEEE